MSNLRFASLDDLSEQEQRDANTRVFDGTGTSFLPVEGLLDLSALRIGAQALPLKETRHYPVNAQLRLEAVEEPLVQVKTRSDGTPVLVRSILSNDGIWPKGAKVFVTGKWDETKPENAKPVPEVAAEKQLEPNATQTSSAPSPKPDIAAILGALTPQDILVLREKLSIKAPPAGGEATASLSIPTGEEHPTVPEQADALREEAHRANLATATGDNRAFAVEGNAPLVVDPSEVLHGVGTGLDDDTFANLPPDVVEKVKSLGTPDQAMVATNEQFNAVGISGPLIVRVRNALKKALPVAT